MASFIRTSDHLTVVFSDGEIATIYPSNPNYDQIILALNNKAWEAVRRLADPADEIKKQIQEHNVESNVRIEGGVVFYDDKPMHNHLTKRMIDMLNEGINIAPLSLFLENLMENPSYRAVNELYGFLEASELPITEDGHFLAYKRITTNWTDAHSKKIDNSIGATPTMPRHEVDEDKNRTCSAGLHFCARSYLSAYGSSNGGRVVVVKINPRDVVAIPSDYNNAKGRTCRYEVINEIELEQNADGDKDYSAMPKAELEDTFRHSGTTTESNTPPTETVERVLAQMDPETGRVIANFATPSEAQQMTGIDSSSISKVARGIRKSAGGYVWGYTAPTSDSDIVNNQLLDDMADDDNDDDEYNDPSKWYGE